MSAMPGVRDVTSLMRERAFGVSTPPLPPEPKASADGYMATAPSSVGSSGFSAGTDSSAMVVKELNVDMKAESVVEFPGKD